MVFYYREFLLLKKHERSEFIVAFGVSGLAPEQDHGVGIYHGSEKVPCVSLLYAFKICFFLPFLRHLLKIAPDVTKKSKV